MEDLLNLVEPLCVIVVQPVNCDPLLSARAICGLSELRLILSARLKREPFGFCLLLAVAVEHL